MNAENIDNNGCSQRDSAEHEGYAKAHRSFNSIWKEKNSAQPELLGKILNKDNLNRAFKRVKANKGAPGIDGITVEEIGAYLKENQQTIIAKIYKGKYTPDAVRRVEIPKPDGGVRKLGIPTVKDRIFQQAITQQLMPLFCGIEEKDMETMLNCLCAYISEYKKDRYIILCQDEVKVVGIILSGKVQMIREDLWGNKTLLVSMGKGELFQKYKKSILKWRYIVLRNVRKDFPNS